MKGCIRVEADEGTTSEQRPLKRRRDVEIGRYIPTVTVASLARGFDVSLRVQCSLAPSLLVHMYP